MNLDTLNRGELLQEIMELAREEGVTSQETWNELCDEVVESHLDLGEIDDDQASETLKQALHMAWPEYQAQAGEESEAAIGEDPEDPHA